MTLFARQLPHSCTVTADELVPFLETVSNLDQLECKAFALAAGTGFHRGWVAAPKPLTVWTSHIFGNAECDVVSLVNLFDADWDLDVDGRSLSDVTMIITTALLFLINLFHVAHIVLAISLVLGPQLFTSQYVVGCVIARGTFLK